jgi:3-hydroxyacyl-CoA dehydrogenase
MPLGPLALLDDVGLDLAAEVGRVLGAAFPGRREAPPLLERLRAVGRTGRKAGRGFYVYEAGSRNRPDPALGKELGLGRDGGPSHTSEPEAAQAAAARPHPANGRPAAAQIERRLLYPMIDEAALCLEERVVGSAAELDLATLAGIGFPPFRGGLLRYADAVGVAGIVGGLERLAAEVGPRLAPSGALRELAARGGFYAAEAA